MGKWFWNFAHILFIIPLIGCQKSPDQKYEELINPLLQKMSGTGRIVDGEIEPSFPEKLGDDAVGTDVNGNSIRDDVDIWINYNSKNSNERKAMKQVAFALTQEITNAHLLNEETALEKSTETQRAVACLSDVVIHPNVFKYKWFSLYNLVFYPDFRRGLKEIHSRLLTGREIGTHGKEDGTYVRYRYCKFPISK